MSRVLGVDPGTLKLGFGVVERRDNRLVPLAHGVVDLSKIESFPQRLATLSAELRRVIVEYRPEAAAVEQVFGGKNMRAALRAAEGRGAVLLTLAQAGLDIHEYSAREIKRAVTGRGGADKSQVAAMVKVLLGLATEPAPDAADALATAICHAHKSAAFR